MLRTSVILRDSSILRAAALRQKKLLTTSAVKKPVRPQKIQSKSTKDDNANTKTNLIAANLRSFNNKRLLASLRDTKTGQAPNIGLNSGKNNTNQILNKRSGGSRTDAHLVQKKKGQNQNGRNTPKNGESVKSSRNATGVNESMHGPGKGVKNRERDANRTKRRHGNATAFHRSATEANNRRSIKSNVHDKNVQGEVSDSNGIEKLRDAFMKSLSADRERRQLKQQQQQQQQTRLPLQGRSNNSESRLDQLLRMTKRSSPNHRNQNSNRNNQSFRERRDVIGGGKFNKRNQIRPPDVPSKADQLLKDLTKEDASSERTVELTGNIEKDIILPNRTITVSELSSIVRVQMKKIGFILKDLGESPQQGEDLDNFKIDLDLAELVALELGLDPKREKRETCSMEAAEGRMRRESYEGIAFVEDPLHETYPTRPPVVCIMGHVDHGKTTLMDRLRQKSAEITPRKKDVKKTRKSKKSNKKKQQEGGVHNVAGTEAGGITQAVSAFQIQLSGTEDNVNGEFSRNDTVTFLDTPGHAAFKAMRQSGSNGADVIVLVVAADDGVSPQTVEIIDMYKTIARSQPGSISMVIAMTKIDKPGIDIEESIMKVENQLMEYEIFSERMSNLDSEFGGVEIVPLSGLTGEGIDELIEGLILHSEIMDLRACQESRAEGLVIDAKIENGLGVVADCIIRWGKLGLGDYVLSGIHGGRVRILNDVNNKGIKTAYPSQPVRIVGLGSLPKAGDPIVCVKSEEIAKGLIKRREALNMSNNEDSYRAGRSNAKLDVIVTGGASKKAFMKNNVLRKYGMDSECEEEQEETKSEESNVIRIPVILKADADGTLAALRETILAIEEESKLDLCIDPVDVSIGHVTQSDVRLANESGAAIFCFNLKGSKDKAAISLASSLKIEIHSNDVIYHLLDQARGVFSGYCPPTPSEQIHGKAVVQEVFDINNSRHSEKVAGLIVKDGNLYLDKIKVGSGELLSEYRIRRNKEIIADNLRAKSLRRVKEEVTDIRRGEECGLNLHDFTDIEKGDEVECYSIEMKRIFV
mmetsp:Transcript_8428/g.12620  ORF Transcript_8428/g.12620 Transcript_8428/m.12620 type:complete len:1040 (-) Transcript_8428:165-3284(-)|eukprot:CAMPEP_0194091462 /NCGR_PEP_ID=MMETSP0149-20130528/43204_1 /TAXON_ID=122233 /ORGANISM="Chaetoceros debilis, Strain MM31A-1" /LENGTH=1039 /DNA_ID=CAMNT_0038776057 /DNA_START=115 /DNA_END=3234 /DNA_ORIENTATION=+